MLTVGYAQNCLSDAAVSPTHAAVGHSAAASSLLRPTQIARSMPPQACFLTQRCIFANFPLFSSSLSPSALQPRPHHSLLHHPLTATWLRFLITLTQSSSPHHPHPRPTLFRWKCFYPNPLPLSQLQHPRWRPSASPQQSRRCWSGPALPDAYEHRFRHSGTSKLARAACAPHTIRPPASARS
jgi:hypothetical protein